MSFIKSPRQWLSLFLGIIFLVGCTPNQSPLPTPIAAVPTPTAVSTPVTFTRIDLSKELYLRQIRKDIFVVTHVFPWPANSLVVEMANSDLVLVGSPYTPEPGFSLDGNIFW
jgi:hypothetical protein